MTKKKKNNTKQTKVTELKPVLTKEEQEAADARRLMLEEMVIAQLTDRQFAPISAETLTKDVTYVTAKNGLFKVIKTPVALYKVLLEEFKNPVMGLPAMEAGVDLLIPKMDFKHIMKALSWYRDVNTKDKTECSTLYFWNHKDSPLPNIPGLSVDGKLVTYCPVQKNSGALSDFKEDENVHWMRENLALLLELHSH